jgi:hypothetical protein
VRLLLDTATLPGLLEGRGIATVSINEHRPLAAV